MSDPTLEDLIAMQLQVQQGYAKIEHPRLVEAEKLLAELLTSPEIGRVRELVAELPDSGVKNALANVNMAISSTHAMVSMELPRLQAMLTPQVLIPGPALVPTLPQETPV